MHEEEVLGKAYDARLMRRLLKYLRPYRWHVAIGIVMLIISMSIMAKNIIIQDILDIITPITKSHLPLTGSHLVDLMILILVTLIFIAIAIIAYVKTKERLTVNYVRFNNI